MAESAGTGCEEEDPVIAEIAAARRRAESGRGYAGQAPASKFELAKTLNRCMSATNAAIPPAMRTVHALVPLTNLEPKTWAQRAVRDFVNRSLANKDAEALEKFGLAADLAAGGDPRATPLQRLISSIENPVPPLRHPDGTEFSRDEESLSAALWDWLPRIIAGRAGLNWNGAAFYVDDPHPDADHADNSASSHQFADTSLAMQAQPHPASQDEPRIPSGLPSQPLRSVASEQQDESLEKAHLRRQRDAVQELETAVTTAWVMAHAAAAMEGQERDEYVERQFPLAVEGLESALAACSSVDSILPFIDAAETEEILIGGQHFASATSAAMKRARGALSSAREYDRASTLWHWSLLCWGRDLRDHFEYTRVQIEREFARLEVRGTLGTEVKDAGAMPNDQSKQEAPAGKQHKEDPDNGTPPKGDDSTSLEVKDAMATGLVAQGKSLRAIAKLLNVSRQSFYVQSRNGKGPNIRDWPKLWEARATLQALSAERLGRLPRQSTDSRTQLELAAVTPDQCPLCKQIREPDEEKCFCGDPWPARK